MHIKRHLFWIDINKYRVLYGIFLHSLFNLEGAYIVYDMVYFDINIELLTGRFWNQYCS